MINRVRINTIVSFLYQIVVVICGMILPRVILTIYGSDSNGLLSSVTQFLSLISFLDLGVGAVVRSNFYKPLVDKNIPLLSKMIKASNRFFKKIANIYLCYIIILLFIFPVIIKDNAGYSNMDIVFLIIVLSLSNLAQYYFGITNQLLLFADQKAYFVYSIMILTVILNTISTAIFAYLGFSLIFVKFITSLIYMLRPLVMSIYIKRHYKIIKGVKLDVDPIEQKWEGFAQHTSAVINNNIDVILLSIFSSMTTVSIYNIYSLVTTSLQNLITSLSVGVESLWGNILAKGYVNNFIQSFKKYEILLFVINTTIYSCTIILILSFINLYTIDINDASYYQPFFAFFLVYASYVFSIRLPYSSVTKAALDYEKTKRFAYNEAIINTVFSLVLVNFWGLIGVAIGTFIANFYRTVVLARYVYKNYLKSNYYKFLLKFIMNNFIIIVSGFFINLIKAESYIQWIINAAITFVILFLFIIILNFILEILIKKVGN